MNTLTMMKKLSLATAGAALLGFGAASAVQAATVGTPTTVVAPNNLATTEGDASNGFPL
jgi:predicted glycosyltransferase